jgi:hypothetical protein
MYAGEFGGDFLKLDDMTLCQLHRVDTFALFTVWIAEIPVVVSCAKPKLLQHPSIPPGY